MILKPLYSIAELDKRFRIVGMQTDNTLILVDIAFAKLEDNKLKKAKLRAKPKEKLMLIMPLIFNSCILS
ncbi:hypothetical protein LCER1_G002696 [Lachnellula cervina]|uniref:Uncharacterized protein n=1 Tax=Lachnellula cervina TaxID=1316786 RepID=A0A7D8YUS0_9HELO|nr:hypothetical protein LCER1_G002696 [Lachnellula cervina]